MAWRPPWSPYGGIPYDGGPYWPDYSYYPFPLMQHPGFNYPPHEQEIREIIEEYHSMPRDQIEQRARLYTRALIIAMDKGCTRLLPLLKGDDSREMCSRILDILLTRYSLPAKKLCYCLDFLFIYKPRLPQSGIASTCGVDTSAVSLLSVLPFISVKLLQVFLQQGCKVSRKEIENALPVLKYGQEPLFEELVKWYQKNKMRGQPDLSWPSIVNKAIENKKWSFFPSILKFGGKMPDDCTIRVRIISEIFGPDHFELTECLISEKCTRHEWVALLPKAFNHTREKRFFSLLEKYVPPSLKEFSLRIDVLGNCSSPEIFLSKLINVYSSLFLKIIDSGTRVGLADVKESIEVVSRGQEHVLKVLITSYERQKLAASLEKEWPMLLAMAIDREKFFLVPVLVDAGASIPDDPMLQFQLASKIDPVKYDSLVLKLLLHCEQSQWIQLLRDSLHSKHTAMISILQRCAPSDLHHYELRRDILSTNRQVKVIFLADEILHVYNLLVSLVQKGIKVCYADVAEAVTSFDPSKKVALKALIVSFMANNSMSPLDSFWSEMLRKVIDTKNASIIPFLFAECKASIPDDATLKAELILNLDVQGAESLVLRMIDTCSILGKTILLESALCQNNDSLVRRLQNPLSIEPQKFDLGKCIISMGHHVELLNQLLDCGVSVEGLSGLSPLSAVMNSPNLLSKAKVIFGCILLKRGAQIGDAFSACEPELVVSVITSLLSDSHVLAQRIAKQVNLQVRTCLVEEGLCTKDVQLLTLAAESGVIGGKPESLTGHSEFLSQNLSLLRKLLDAGWPIPLLPAVLEQKTPDRMEMACFLVSYGSDVQQLHHAEESPVHFATKVAIETGNTKFLEAVCSKFDFPPSGKLIDGSKQTPFHLAMRAQCKAQTSLEICEILSRFHIDTQIKDSSGRKAEQYGKRNDKRYKYLHRGSKKKLKARAEQQSSRDHGVEKSKTVHMPEVKVGQMPSKEDTSSSLSKPPSKLVEKRDLSALLSYVLDNDDSYFVEDVKTTNTNTPTVVKNFVTNGDNLSSQIEQVESVLYKVDDDLDVDETSDTPGTSLENFENATWEVECTEKVLKFLKNQRYPKSLREAAIKKIKRLASGCWPSKKDVGNTTQLFELKLTKAARILWEVAVQFSSRCTDKVTDKSQQSKQIIHVYSEVIRLWDVVLDHDLLHHCIANIEKSRERGMHADIQLSLLPRSNSEETGENLPKLFLLNHPDAPSVEEVACLLQKFIPAASVKDDEYNVVTFYSVSTALVNSMLYGEDVRRDFPFKEWPKEHDIINMPMNQEAILLLGRSGTGKTTCCLYRLWNHFRSYWEQVASSGGDALYQRNPLPLFVEDDHQSGEESDEPESVVSENVVPDSPGDVFDETYSSVECISFPGIPNYSSSTTSFDLEEVEPTNSTAELSQTEHLHQVFVTKNYVLCAQMKKRFYDMAASHPELAVCMQFENQELPHSFDQVDDNAFPLFLTSRQFLTMLDNSISNSKTFFPRNPDGSLAVKVHSLDYDHEDPDTLLDLEGSDSEEEEDEDQGLVYDAPTHHAAAKQHSKVFTEVTAAFFVEEVWHKISHSKGIDPLLVWMEIKSFIKGSAQAMQSRIKGRLCGYLSKADYEALGRSMAANFVGNRNEVYDLFEQYQGYLRKHRAQNLFDECQLVHSIHQRLSQLKEDLNWSIHHFYIDEVQDFTQAELSLFLQCCRDPNGLFLTGDTAQSIMRGIAFRFSDLRSLFYFVKERVKRSMYPLKVLVPKIQELTINFRSHSGILQLAGSIIDLLKEYFPASFDRLPDDKGMFAGPKPVLLESCQISDLALLLHGNKRESSAIEFGAHQVIIVQTDEAKKNLPESLRAAITLTVFESKGLEFDDVLLYNFFNDSPIDKQWRLVTTFVDKVSPCKTDKPTRTSSTSSQPRALEFDEQCHKSLNAELKYLYTAITRAKCNLWIYDAHETKRLPVFDYWKRLGLVKVVSVGEGDDDSSLFTATSTPEQWKQQGEYFRKKGLWEPAIKCYKKAGDELMEKEADAFLHVKRAQQAQNPRDIKELFAKAAELFLTCDQAQHSYKFLLYAAKCLKFAKQHSEAAKLFERLGQHDLARRGYLKAKDYLNIARLREADGDFSGAVRVLKIANRRLEALERAVMYEKDGKSLDKDVSAGLLADDYARYFASTGNKEKLKKVLTNVTEFVMRVKYLKMAKLYQDATEEFMKNGKLREAEQIIVAYKLFDFGMDKAKKRGDSMGEARFLLQKITSLMQKEMSESVKNKLRCELKLLASSKNSSVKAHALLLNGKLNSDPSLCNSAKLLYAKMNIPGMLEAFNELMHLNKEQTLSSVTRTCIAAGQIALAIQRHKKSASDTRLLEQALQFYHLQEYEDVYLLAESQDLWANLHIAKCKENPKHDGMLRLQPSAVHNHLHDHFMHLFHTWIKASELEAKITERLNKYPFHKDLYTRGYLSESYKEYLPGPLNEYLEIIIAVVSLKQFTTKFFAGAVNMNQMPLYLFVPHVFLRLPVKSMHKKTLQYSKYVRQMLSRKVDGALSPVSLKAPKVELLFEVWQACCIINNVAKMQQRLVEFSATTREEDAGYTLTRTKDQIHHFFWYWIYSCKLIREQYEVVASISFVVYKFFAVIARRKSLRETTTFSDFFYVSALCSVALLSVIGMLTPKMSVIIPGAYERIVNLFDELNIENRTDRSLFSACCWEVDDVQQTGNKSYMISLHKQATHHLEHLLDILLGFKFQDFHILRHIFSSAQSVENGSAARVLSLTLCLVANLLVINRTKASGPYKCLQEIYDTLGYVLSSDRRVTLPLYFSKVYDGIGKAGCVAEIVEVVKDIHFAINDIATLCTPIMPPISRTGIPNTVNILKPLPLSQHHKEIKITPLAQFTHPFKERKSQQSQDQGVSDQQQSVQRVSSLMASAVDETLPAHPDPRTYLTASMQDKATRTYDSQPVSQFKQEPDADESDPPIAEEKMAELLSKQYEIPHTPGFAHSHSIEDTAMIDRNYCRYCGVSLKTTEQDSLEARINEATEERVIEEAEQYDPDTLTYEQHLQTPMHIQKKRDYKKFEDFKIQNWDPLTQEVASIITEIEKTHQIFTEAEKCKQDLDNIRHNLSQLEHHQNWGECSRLVEKAIIVFEKMPSRLKEIAHHQQQQQYQQEHSSEQAQASIQLSHNFDVTEGDDDQEDDYEELDLRVGNNQKQKSKRKRKPRQRH